MTRYLLLVTQLLAFNVSTRM